MGSGKGAPLSAGALLGSSFLGTWKDMGRSAQGTEITLYGGPAGEYGSELVYRGFAKDLNMDTFLHRGPGKYHWGSAHQHV